MRVSVCVGDYAATPYCIPGLERNVYSMEELCYCIKENAFLLDLSLLNDGLLDWIEKECGLQEFAKALHSYVHKQGSLSSFVAAILEYVGLYDHEMIQEVGRVLKQGAGLSAIERRKNQIDYLVRKKSYKAAVKGYDSLLQKWQEAEEGENASMPAASCLAAIWHNKGVAFAGLMLYERAAECFLKAYELGGGEDCCLGYLAAERMLLSEEAYVAFASQHKEFYPCTLELEKKLEEAAREWEQHADYLRLYNRRELRHGDDKQKYYEDNERITLALKDSYRKE